MLKLKLSEDSEAFREGFASWLKLNPPPDRASNTSLEQFVSVGRKWQRKLADGAWLGVHWPTKFGGRGLSLVEEAIVQEELVRVGAPQILGLFGISMVGPVLIEHGTESQRSRYLKKILTGEEIWCQGFSEPGAGSDLASIRTKAVCAKDGFVVSGQKVWTSFAQVANWVFTLCRTSDSGEKHEGLTYLLIDLNSPGVSVRPLKQISGDTEFNEIFFDEVVVPSENIVGQVGQGWKIAIATLMYERLVLTFARQLQSETALRGLVEDGIGNPDIEMARALAGQVATGCAVRALAYDHILSYSNGGKPGPEGSIDKLFWSESFQEIAKLGLKASGYDALLGESGEGEAVHRYLYSRGRTIAAGTSEIQRSIIAERVLALPRLKFRE